MAFLVGRHLVRVMVERKINDYPKFKAVDAAIEDEGWKVVDLLRPSPTVPFSLQNWFLGTTKVGFLPYVVATFAGIMPGTLLYVWIGSLGANAGGEGPTAKYILFGVGLIATLAVTILVGRKAKAKLDEHA
ncbi:VTT domain-containing protein [uncultured Tateyamaria sp.]|uniref:TVP38/TMEM64 family protein n=1 Tax=uncultured Tateyamaria sp. TaxID=455651 RepID=UPI0026163AD2|nr:VTT domain-containing protein [uncultured Tateyamaria sp.]